MTECPAEAAGAELFAHPHPLLSVLTAAADGVFPPADGAVRFVPPLAGEVEAVVSFTAVVFLATALSATDFHDLPLDAYGAALRPAVLQRLARGGEAGVLDVTLVARGGGTGQMLEQRDDLDEHPRVRHARRWRRDVHVYADERGLVTVSQGLAERTELSVELWPAAAQGRGHGADLITDALAGRPAGEPVFASVSPGNARSLRSFLACGFRPVGSEILLAPGTPHSHP